MFPSLIDKERMRLTIHEKVPSVLLFTSPSETVCSMAGLPVFSWHSVSGKSD